MSIDFKISDKDFLENVWTQSITFKNGSFIDCNIKIINTTDLDTNETKTARIVTNVINYGDNDKGTVKVIHKKVNKIDDSVDQLTIYNLPLNEE